MAELLRLSVTGVRNIAAANIHPALRTNLIIGDNGSGKTSLLEAIYLLGTGRSLRGSRVSSLVNHEADALAVFAEFRNGDTLGLEKPRSGRHTLRLRGENQRSWEYAARLLPMQVLDAHAFSLLDGGPIVRRRFLDWGVFHVEPSFLKAWRTVRKCLSQRNQLLKASHLDRAQLSAWDRELVAAAHVVDRARSEHFAEFLPKVEAVATKIADDNDISSASPASRPRQSLPAFTITYDRGWHRDRSLTEVLAASLEHDLKYRATQHGPHRAELVISCGSQRAVDVLSRGQQKMLVCALKLTQGLMISQARGVNCIYLVDDLAAELDARNRARVFSLLREQGCQSFITSVEPEAIRDASPLDSAPGESRTFHVEHGTIEPL